MEGNAPTDLEEIEQFVKEKMVFLSVFFLSLNCNPTLYVDLVAHPLFFDYIFFWYVRMICFSFESIYYAH